MKPNAMGGRDSPNRTATSAATAPSVDATGAARPTFPARSAKKRRSIDTIFPTPAIAIHPTVVQSADRGVRVTMMAVMSIPSPINMIQLSTDAAPIQRVDLVEDSVDKAHITAAPRPPTTAITVGADLSCHCRGKMRDAVAQHRGALPSRGSLAATTRDVGPNLGSTDVHRRPLICSFLNAVSGGERFNGRTLLGSICTCHCSQ